MVTDITKNLTLATIFCSIDCGYFLMSHHVAHSHQFWDTCVKQSCLWIPPQYVHMGEIVMITTNNMKTKPDQHHLQHVSILAPVLSTPTTCRVLSMWYWARCIPLPQHCGMHRVAECRKSMCNFSLCMQKHVFLMGPHGSVPFGAV